VLNTSPAATKVLILDCCYSGLAVANTQTSTGSAVLARVVIFGTCTLTATAEHQEAIAPPGDQYTAFTGELISILRDGVAGGPADLDLNTIYHQLGRAADAPGAADSTTDDHGHLEPSCARQEPGQERHPLVSAASTIRSHPAT
jgi:hypothetical protein